MRSLAEKLLTLPRAVAKPVAVALERGNLVAPTQTRHGPVQLIERIHGPSWVQGKVAVAPARLASAATLSRLSLDPALGEVDPRTMLFVDTETTGLRGGAGTLPFLVGLAWFEGESLKVCQLFLGQPGEERPLLSMLAQRLAASALWVTFNGKCFDWPLLKTRYVLNRLEVPPARPHLDLLHCARRVFKRRLHATRLVDLEAAVLGFAREGDLDGGEIPAVYFDWLRRGARGLLQVVLEHNVRDLVSMAAVLAELCRRYEMPSEDDAAPDCLSMARVAWRANDFERAGALAQLAASRSAEPAVAFEANVLMARGAVRAGNFHEAAAFARRAAFDGRLPWSQRAQAHLMLARLFEHRLRDREAALVHARLSSAAEAPDVHARRVARLEARTRSSPLGDEQQSPAPNDEPLGAVAALERRDEIGAK